LAEKTLVREVFSFGVESENVAWAGNIELRGSGEPYLLVNQA